MFVIVLENESAAVTFGPGSPAPYLSKTLPARGAFVPNYYGVGHASLDNYIAMISGQAPTPPRRPTAACSPTSPPRGRSDPSASSRAAGACIPPA